MVRCLETSPRAPILAQHNDLGYRLNSRDNPTKSRQNIIGGGAQYHAAKMFLYGAVGG